MAHPFSKVPGNFTDYATLCRRQGSGRSGPDEVIKLNARTLPRKRARQATPIRDSPDLRAAFRRAE